MDSDVPERIDGLRQILLTLTVPREAARLAA
jgi:hypothetical protein